jgi:hypothetical protein
VARSGADSQVGRENREHCEQLLPAQSSAQLRPEMVIPFFQAGDPESHAVVQVSRETNEAGLGSHR